MKHKSHRKRIKRLKRRYRRLAAALAGAAVLTSTMLPGLPAAVAHAAVNPNADAPVATQQQVGQDQAKDPAQINANAQKKQVTARQTAPKEFEQVLDIVATAYAPGPHDNDQWGDRTYLGTKIRPGVIAVDPDVIPLGSRVYIQFPDGTGQYAVAEDTGGAIKGNRIDIALPTVKQAEDFGIKNVKVYVLSTPDTQKA